MDEAASRWAVVSGVSRSSQHKQARGVLSFIPGCHPRQPPFGIFTVRGAARAREIWFSRNVNINGNMTQEDSVDRTLFVINTDLEAIQSVKMYTCQICWSWTWIQGIESRGRKAFAWRSCRCDTLAALLPSRPSCSSLPVCTCLKSHTAAPSSPSSFHPISSRRSPFFERSLFSPAVPPPTRRGTWAGKCLWAHY